MTTSFLTCPTRRSRLSWRPLGAIVLFPLGIYFLVRTVKEPLRAYASARQRWDEGTVPGHLITEVADAAALTIFNPVTIAYWVGVTANWLPFAHSVLGYSAPGLGILMATAGLMTWFTALTVIVRFIPHRIGPNFFRLVNAILGLILLGFATFCAIVLLRHPPHSDAGFPRKPLTLCWCARFVLRSPRARFTLAGLYGAALGFARPFGLDHLRRNSA